MRTGILTLGLSALLASGCSQPAAGGISLPEGETNLSCAAVIYAATNLVETPDTSVAVTDYVGVMTRYATAHAEETGIEDGLEAFNLVKIEANMMTGRMGSRSVVLSDNGVMTRAQACYEA